MAIKDSIKRLRSTLLGQQPPMSAAPERLWWGGTPPRDYEPDLSDLVDPSLEQLADAFGSDKGRLGAGHGYTAVYEELISDLRTIRGGERLSICEIGVACGASLKMWSRYLPEAKVVGIDVREDCAKLCRDWANIEIKIGDPRTLRLSPSHFDLIVDDASHISEDIRANFDHCFPWLRPGGFYVVEDVTCVGNKAYAESLMERYELTGLKNERATFTEMVDDLMLDVDSRTGQVARIAYHPGLLVIEKRAQNS
jgi:predicted O-methyltransferase YrrM